MLAALGMKLFASDHLLSMSAAPIIWSGHFVVCYAVVALACALGWTDARVLDLAVAPATVLLATLAALTLLGMSAAHNMKKIRRVRTSPSEAAEVSGFVATAALLLCLLSGVAIMWVATPAIILPACTP